MNITDEKCLVVKPIELETIVLNSQMSSFFCMSWSADDKISVIVDGGIYILELKPTDIRDNQSITLVKYWIPSPSTTPLAHLVINKGSFLAGLRKAELYDFALDAALYTTTEKGSSASSGSHVLQCEFSPLIGSQSYLSCLTNHGLLEIYKREYNKWTSVLDVTQLWIAHCTPAEGETTNVQDLKERILELSIASTKWTTYLGRPVLVTSHKNGGLCFWTVERQDGALTATVFRYLNLAAKLSAFAVCPISPSSALIVAGSVKGSVTCHLVDLTTGLVDQRADLWPNDDLMSVAYVKIDRRESQVRVYIVKRHVLLLGRLSVDDDSKTIDVAPVKWIEFPSPVTSVTDWRDGFGIGLQNHNFHYLSVTDDDLNYDLEEIDMGIKSKHRASYHCHGLAMSKNKTIWVMASSPKVAYQSSRDVGILSVYKTDSMGLSALSVAPSVSDLVDDLTKLRPDTKFADIYDLLELKRLELLSDESRFKEEYGWTESSNLLELQVSLWEAKLKQFCQSVDLDAVISGLELAIVRRAAKDAVSYLQARGDTLSESERESLTAHQKLLSKAERSDLISTTCVICGSQSVFESVRVSSCPNSHRFPRCCLSLLPCDRVPYAVCTNCDSVALTSSVSESMNLCPFCEGILIPCTGAFRNREIDKAT